MSVAKTADLIVLMSQSSRMIPFVRIVELSDPHSRCNEISGAEETAGNRIGGSWDSPELEAARCGVQAEVSRRRDGE